MNEKQIACKDYKKYKGIRRPQCMCILCRDKYIDTLETTNRTFKKALWNLACNYINMDTIWEADTVDDVMRIKIKEAKGV